MPNQENSGAQSGPETTSIQIVADVLSTLDAREVAALDAALPVLAKLATGDGGAGAEAAGVSRKS